jgi:protein transport protein SEC31
MELNGKDFTVIAVCPIGRFGNYVVAASGSGNRDPENSLTVYKFEAQNVEEPLRKIASVKVSVPFSTIGWTRYGEETKEHEFGFIVGGHEDGSVSLWEATAIIGAKENKKINFGLLQSKKFHSSRVNVIKFNQKPSLFASGSREIVIISIEKNLTLESPVKCPSQDDTEITSLAWNEKVPYILSSATLTGTTYIWEMKKSEVFLRIVDQGIIGDPEEERVQQPVITKTLWCSDGVQILIAYDHPDFTFLTQYHMKQPSAPTAEYHGGHREPICDITKNPHDTNFILTLGKDDTVTLWSLRTQKALVHIPMNEKITSILWLNKTPDVFVAVSASGVLSHYQVNFSTDAFNKGENVELPPKWLFKKSGMSFAFGGKFATFSEKNSSNITLHSLSGNLELSTKMKTFIEKTEKIDSATFLEEKILSSKDNHKDKNATLFWVTLKCLLKDDYQQLFTLMGFEKNKLQSEVYAFIGKKSEKTQNKERQRVTLVNNNINDEAEEFWNTAMAKNDKEEAKVNSKSTEVLNEKPMTIQETVTKNINWNQGAEKLIKHSLLIGDLESAVDVALKCGREAEALLIASAGDKNLFNKAKASFFNKNKDLFIKNIFSSIINGNFEALFEYNVLKDWKEYILYAKTYLQGGEFINFANNLGDRLSSNTDIYMALVCYALGRNYEKCVELLYNNYLKETEKLGKNEKKYFTQNLFEHIISLNNILSSGSDAITDKIISEYCEILINEGLFTEALSYLSKLKNSNNRILTLYDRLQNHCDYNNKYAKLQPPFNIIVVKPKIEKVAVSSKAKGLSTNTGANTNKLPTKTGKDILWDEPQDKKNPFENKPVKNLKGFGNNRDEGHPSEIVNQPKPSENRVPLTKNPFHKSNPPNEIKPNPLNELSNTNNSTINSNVTTEKRPTPGRPVNPPMPLKRSSVEPETPIQNNPSPVINPPVRAPNVPPKNVLPRPVNSLPNLNKTETTTTPAINKLVPSSSVTSLPSQSNIQPMSTEEELVHSSFEKFIDLYNSSYPDDNKQKDFFNRVSPLLTKLKNHEIKINLLKLLVEFINSKIY